MAAPASSSYDGRSEKYEVFVSFRGEDVRVGFLSHLRKELLQNNIVLFEDESLERGEEISSALMEAIEASKISLVIFSKDYASSTWCLDELVKIMECRKENQQIVIPVFYRVDPSHVRKQSGTYADAFAKHEENFGSNKEKLQNWKSALTKAAGLSGCRLLDAQDESKFIRKIVKCIVKKSPHKRSRKPTDSKLLAVIYQIIDMMRSLITCESTLDWSTGEEGEHENSRGTNPRINGNVRLSIGNETSRPNDAVH